MNASIEEKQSHTKIFFIRCAGDQVFWCASLQDYMRDTALRMFYSKPSVSLEVSLTHPSLTVRLYP